MTQEPQPGHQPPPPAFQPGTQGFQQPQMPPGPPPGFHGYHQPGFGPMPPVKRKGLSPGAASLIFGGAGLLVGLLVGGVMGAGFATGGLGGTVASPIPAAVEACNAEFLNGVTVGDEGRSLSIDTAGEDYGDTGTTTDRMDCLLNELNVSDSVRTRIGTTRALDGRQTGDWNNLTASWGYHPDSGMSLLIEVAD